MARTGTGSRRPRAKTTGSGDKAGTASTETQATENPEKPAPAPKPTDDQPESGSGTDTASTGTDTLAAAEGNAPSAGMTAQSAGAMPDDAVPGGGEALVAQPGATSESPTTTDDASPRPDATTDAAAGTPPAPPVASATAPGEPVPAPASRSRRGGAAGMILGGVIAAAIGAAAALALFPQGWQPADTAALEARLAALETRAEPDAVLEERLTALENVLPEMQPVDLQPLDARVSDLDARLEALVERLTTLEADDPSGDLEQRIAQLENDLAARIDAAIDQELGDVRARQAEQVQAIEEAEQDLASASARLEARAALAELAAAAETGQPAPTALPALAAVTDLPPGMEAFAEGLPQLRNLQAGFADAARNALAAAPLDEGRAPGDRIVNFLRSQTGARSLAPREGEDTDAILSRAEAHVRDADLSAALAELRALPAGPAAAMADWQAQAEARLNALAALAEVQTRMNNQ